MKKTRSTNIELLRIILMIVIVAHHYVVNSGLMNQINSDPTNSLKDIYLLIFGWGGKTAINIFILITGFYMCKSNITIIKFMKIYLELVFYKVLIYLCFVVSGICSFKLIDFVLAIFPFKYISNGFFACYLLFFLLIPFINRLISALSKKEYTVLLLICFGIYTAIGSIPGIVITFNYITWFVIMYFLGAYIRLYPNKIFESKTYSGLLMVLFLLLSWISIPISGYRYVSDSNKILAVLTAMFAFLYFKNIEIKYNKVINSIATTTFGVLCIHANSDLMRQWLWVKTLKNVEQYQRGNILLHSIISVIGVYCLCVIIDFIRIKLIEKPLFEKIGQIKIINKKIT